MKRQRTRVLLAGLLLVATPISAREWTSSNGMFSVDAELVDVKNGIVRLKREDGSVVTFAASKLSRADRDYLVSIAKAKPKTEATKASLAEVNAALNAAEEKAKEWRQKADEAQGNLNEMKKMFGFAAVDTLKEIQTKWKKDMEVYKGVYPGKEGVLNYRELINHLAAEIRALEQDRTQAAAIGALRGQITVAGLKHLKRLKITSLSLSGTNVNDAGLDRLSGLKSLRYLYLLDTKVTDEGVKKLQQALPNCKIYH
jgi:hypothetical protein